MNDLLTKTMGFVKEHSPEILISTGVVGMATSTVLAVRATPKALQLIREKEEELGVVELTKKELVEATWKQYIPAVGVGAVSAACIVLGTSKNIKRNAALATVYALSENTLKEYQRKTREIVGVDKAREIESEVAKARVVKRETVIAETRDSEYVIHTGNGDTLVYDSLSGRYFRSSRNAIEAAVNCVNKQLNEEYTASVNDFYNELDIPTIGAGNLIGWRSDKEQLDISFDSDVDRMGNPYLILEYYNRPIPLNGYSQSW